MKCRNCDREAVYDDGLCEACHQQAQQEAQVMSDHERDNFNGKTIEEDGTVREERNMYQQQDEQEQPTGFQVYTSNISWRVKLALGFIIFCVIAVIIGVLGFIVVAMPYLIGAFLIYFVYNIVKAILKR
ncbi:MAG: hypothetical protein LKF74_01700 [Megasphaera sp.]|jgi:hypothetical protein|nr:hypothetical protein [Megasphaera sp.]MCH4187292.1 hypothetical protein [Megasphaera sp.]MCH4217258.1 hypothetical protein [Megasphaera sp.]